MVDAGRAGSGIWKNTPLSTELFELARNKAQLGDAGILGKLKKLVAEHGTNAVLETRASDGKGALHWAYEFECSALREWLESQRGEPTRDSHGKFPASYGPKKNKKNKNKKSKKSKTKKKRRKTKRNSRL